MTREEIKNLPEIVDFMLDRCVLADSRTKVGKRLEEVCDLAIKAVEQASCEDAVSRQAVLKQLKGCLTGGETEYNYVKIHIDSIPPVTPQPKMGMELKIKELEKRIEVLERGPLYEPYKVESEMKLTCTDKSCSNCKCWLLDKDDENRRCEYCFDMDEWEFIDQQESEE